MKDIAACLVIVWSVVAIFIVIYDQFNGNVINLSKWEQNNK